MKKAAKELIGIAKSLTAADTDGMVAAIAEGLAQGDKAIERAAIIADKGNKKAYKADNALERSLRGASKEEADAVIEALRKNKVDTGRLGSRTVDLLEKLSGQKIYPSPWPVMKQRYYISEV